MTTYPSKRSIAAALAFLVVSGLAGCASPSISSLSTSGGPPRGGAAEQHFTSQSEEGNVEFHIAAENAWYDKGGSFGFGGEIAYGDAFSLQLKSDVADILRWTGHEDDDFRFLESRSWEQARGSDTTLILAFWDDRLRLTSRYGLSDYTAEEGDEDSDSRSTAVSQRIDARLWEQEGFSLSAFGAYSDVAPSFEHIETIEEKERIGWRNREELEAGTIVGLGPVSLTLSHALSQKLSDADSPQEVRDEADLALDLSGLRASVSALPGGSAWEKVLPGSVWVKLGRGRIEPIGDDAADDATNDLSFGASWNWDGAYANVSVWRALYDGDQSWSDYNYNWTGNGVYLDFGLYDRLWDFYAGFGMGQSAGQETSGEMGEYGSDMSEYSYEGNLSLTARPERWPDLSFIASVGRYGGDYVEYGEWGGAYPWAMRVVILRATLDFSKYLSKAPDKSGSPRLKLLYQFETPNWQYDTVDPNGGAEHILALAFWLPL